MVGASASMREILIEVQWRMSRLTSGSLDVRPIDCVLVCHSATCAERSH